MNAYELANALNDIDEVDYRDLVLIENGVKMLRQQADRIAFLENSYFEAWKLLNNGMIELASNARKIIKEAEKK